MSGERRNLIAGARTLVGTPRFNPIKLASDSKAVIGLNMLKLWDAKGSLDEFIDPLTEWVADGQAPAVVAEAFPLERGRGGPPLPGGAQERRKGRPHALAGCTLSR